MFERMVFGACWIVAACLASMTVGCAAAEGDVPGTREALPSFSDPALSPDRSEIAFVAGGDIWTVAAAGGEARLLVANPATESRPLYSPDGKRLAFVSTRTGNGDIYVLTLSTSELKRITYDDSHEYLDAWSRDGKWLYFTSSSQDIASMNDVFRVSADGGTPMPVSADRFANEFFCAPSPDGLTLAFTARGIASSQWWRKGHSHLDESEIWTKRDTGYERISSGGAKDMWPMWSADGTRLFFMSDRSGAQNIWSKRPNEAAQKITAFTDGRVLWPTISQDGSTIIFERNFGIWTLNIASGQTREIPISLRGAPSDPTIEHANVSGRIHEFALSPDGRKVAFVAHGEVFAGSARDGGDALRVTRTASVEESPSWAPDSKRLVYVSPRFGAPHVFMYDFQSNAETQITHDEMGDSQPTFSPDGKLLAFERGAGELRVLDMASKKEHVVATGEFDRPPFNGKHAFAWSPDSRWLAYTAPSSKSFRNVNLVPVEGGPSRQVSFVANVFSNALSWSPDGTYLLFHSNQRTENGQITRIDLIPRHQKFREDQFRELFRDEPVRVFRAAPSTASEPAKEPAAAPAKEALHSEPKKPGVKAVEIVFENIRQRVTVLPAGVDAHSATISPDGKMAVLIAGANGQRNLYTYAIDESGHDNAVARQLTSTPGNKSDAQFSPDGKEVYFLDQGRINAVPLDTRTPRTIGLNAEMDVDFSVEKIEVFNEAWTYLRDNFFDEKFNGVDWNAARKQYAPRVAGARTPDDLRRIISLMLGELNASHMGISSPSSASEHVAGRLGLRFNRTEYENSGRLLVTEVIPLGPASISGIKIGDTIVAVDGVPMTVHANLDEMLLHKINRRVMLTVEAGAKNAANAARREVAVRPISSTSEKPLVYRKWVEERRAYVARVSNGRLGYVHMADMSEGSLSQLYVDLDAENHARDGVVMDVRNNNGGFVNAYAIDVLARRPYLSMTGRGQHTASARTMLGQRALESPTILVCNQHSLSDAEDFTEGYRALKLGKVVGEPTAGWIVYTANEPLLDGSVLRLPFVKVTTSSGEPLEMHPRPVDIEVQRPIGESYTERDSQLDAAVAELLKQIGPVEKH